MVKIIIVIGLGLCLVGCGKVGLSGSLHQFVGDWAEVTLPDGCRAKAIAGEEGNGTIVLCEDGRVFH